MIKEIVHFVENLEEEFKSRGIKPKEGLHILVPIIEDKKGSRLDINAIQYERYTKKRETSPLLNKCANLAVNAWMVNTNKCFDLPKKAIHSCSPFCASFKREHLEGGAKYLANEKKGDSQIYDRFVNYFEKTATLAADGLPEFQQSFEALFVEVDSTNYFSKILAEIEAKFEAERTIKKLKIEEKQTAFKATKDKSLKAQYKEDIKQLELDLEANKELSDSDYIVFYLDIPLEQYKAVHKNYLTDKLFNKDTFNTKPDADGIIYGVSDFFNSIDSGGKKPFLLHQTATFNITGRISNQDAQNLYEFGNLLSRKTLPNPLPIFIYQEELQRDAIALFKSADLATYSYREMIETLSQKHKADLGNYYLLNWFNTKDGLVFNDFDFVPKFEYHLRDEKDAAWTIQNLFELLAKGGKQAKTYPKLNNVFELEQQVFKLLLQNKYKRLDYFNELDKKGYEDLSNTFFCYSKYRKAVYNYVYKSQRQAISGQAFNDMLFSSIKDDLKNLSKNESYQIKEKLNIWFSLYEKFNPPLKDSTMASKLKDYQQFVEDLVEQKQELKQEQTIAYFAFTAGQVIHYILKKSKSDDNSYRLLEPYLQQSNIAQFKATIAKDFARYKHENFSKRFEQAAAFVLTYETTENLKKYTPEILAGVFSKNQLFASK